MSEVDALGKVLESAQFRARVLLVQEHAATLLSASADLAALVDEFIDFDDDARARVVAAQAYIVESARG